MYIRVCSGGSIIDITNNRLTDNKVYFDVKYILGKDSVVFREEEDGRISVERRRRDLTLYKTVLDHGKDYMITPLFVEIYKHNHPTIRDLYAYLKRNFNGNFYIEENNNISKPFEVVFSAWVDVKFDYKIKILVNTNRITEDDTYRLRGHISALKDMNLYNLYMNIQGRSIFIDDASLKLMRSIDSLYHNANEEMAIT